MTLSKWIRATWLGWLAGVPLIVLFALAGEAIGIGGAQSLVGLGMGVGVGLLQARALRGVFGRTAPWMWSCAIGLTLPFLAADLLRVTGHENRYALEIAVAIGGTIVGVWQAYLLRARSTRAAWWIPASAIGWALAALSAWAADGLSSIRLMRGIAGALLFLGITASGGLVLGISTGVVLVRLLRDYGARTGTGDERFVADPSPS